MRRLLSLLALCLTLLLGATPSFAADVAHGGQIFSANCAACHMGGGNVVNAERTLKQDALEAYLANYSSGHEAAIAYQVTNGKNAMPALVASSAKATSLMWRPMSKTCLRRAGPDPRQNRNSPVFR